MTNVFLEGFEIYVPVSLDFSYLMDEGMTFYSIGFYAPLLACDEGRPGANEWVIDNVAWHHDMLVEDVVYSLVGEPCRILEPAVNRGVL
jgi:hypothetical protein